MTTRIAQVIYTLNDLGISSEEQRSIWDGLMTLSSLTYQISKTPNKESISVTICKSRMEYMTLETLAMIHARLDAMSSEISKVIRFRNPHDIISASCWIRRVAGLPRVSETRQKAYYQERCDPFSHPGGPVPLSFLLLFQPQSPWKKQTPKRKAFFIGKLSPPYLPWIGSHG